MAKKIHKNFLVISQYNRDISWVPEYTNDYLIYDRSEDPHYPKTIDISKVVTSPNVGYNSYDYCRFIVDHYDNLPEVTIFAKAWTFPRHITQEFFDKVMNNEYFTPLEEYTLHQEKWPYGFFSAEGGFCELNTDLFLNEHRPTKFFHSYNDFLRFCFKNPLIPRYRRFAPGGDYIIPRTYILKYPKVFYENLVLFMSHDKHCGETHIIERAFHTMMTCNFEVNEKMLGQVDEKKFIAKPRQKIPSTFKERVQHGFRNEIIRFLKKTTFSLEAKNVSKIISKNP